MTPDSLPVFEEVKKIVVDEEATKKLRERKEQQRLAAEERVRA